jgi:steroid 5-alpha reductase family enzyme
MFDLYTTTLIYFLVFGFIGWVLSLFLKNVTHVDSMWALFPLLGTFVCMQTLPLNLMQTLFFFLIFLWSLRLFAYLTKRNWGKAEDSRYQVIRKNNEPLFKYKSLYIIFWLQAFMASILMLSIIPIFINDITINTLSVIGFLLAFFGLAYESIADWQLSNFLKSKKGSVMNQGLWRYSRHPNYFGEFLVWWGIYLISFNSIFSFTLLSPILMSLLLLKVSGAELLESTIVDRRQGYAKYIKQTPMFFPWFRKR